VYTGTLSEKNLHRPGRVWLYGSITPVKLLGAHAPVPP